MGIFIAIRDALAPPSPHVAAPPSITDTSSPRPEFSELVRQALDALPIEFASTLANTAVTIRSDGTAHGAYGLYYGPTIVGTSGPGVVVLFEDTLTRDFGDDPVQLAHEVEHTLRHELAHHLGFRERAMSSLGL